MPKNKINFLRTNLFNFESKTLLDEELDHGILPENKLNIATVLFFVFLELLMFSGAYLYSFSVLEIVFYSLFALFLARQIALDFAYHVFLDIYTFPMALAAVFMPQLLGNGTILESLMYGISFFLILLLVTLICSFIKKSPAGFGGGDIKFAFVMGGFIPGFILLISIFISCVISLFLTFFYKDKTNIPFGPGLLLSFWLCLIFRDDILTLIFKYLG